MSKNKFTEMLSEVLNYQGPVFLRGKPTVCVIESKGRAGIWLYLWQFNSIDSGSYNEARKKALDWIKQIKSKNPSYCEYRIVVKRLNGEYNKSNPNY